MTNAVEATDWKRLNETLAASEKLLAYTLEGNEDAVAITKAYEYEGI